MAARILIIEDESAIADNVVYALNTEGYDVVWKSLGSDGVAALQNGAIDLVILDVGLPDMSGFEVCKQIRQFSQVPIIFLTARSEEIDRVVGLEIGGDDYISKPFSPRELVARIKAILKRLEWVQDDCQDKKSNCFIVDEDKAKIYYYDQSLDLTRYEYFILKTLLRQPERIYSRSQIMDQAWEMPETRLERSVDTHIKSLRAKLRAIRPDRDPIKTHRGLGYSIQNHEN